MSWKITWGGHELTDEQVTVEQVLAVATLTGRDEWDCIAPASTPRTLAAWCAVVMAHGIGEPVDACLLFVLSRPLRELTDALTVDAPDTVEPATAP